MSLFDIANLKTQIEMLKEKTLNSNFWDDLKTATRVSADLKRMENKVQEYESINSELSNLVDMNELLLVEADEGLAKETISSTESLYKKMEELELQTLLSGKYDVNNAIVTLHPGAGRYRVAGLG